jgi:hypothetical protein
MPLSLEQVLPLAIIASAVLVCVTSCIVFVPAVYRKVSSRFWLGGWGDTTHQRRCRYCRLGRAQLHEETARVEGDDLVEVRCFVCRSCGLPQWTVNRSAVLKKAA